MVKPKVQTFPVLLDHMQIPNSGSAITAEPIPNLSKSSEIQTDFLWALTTQYTHKTNLIQGTVTDTCKINKNSSVICLLLSIQQMNF